MNTISNYADFAESNTALNFGDAHVVQPKLMPKSVTINGRSYTVVPLNPSLAFDFIHHLIHARVTGINMAGIGKAAIGQCCNPIMKRLSEAVVFEEHFSQYPEDMLPLETAAIQALTAPYDPPNDEAADTGDKQ